jgi:hypothetical protein
MPCRDGYRTSGRNHHVCPTPRSGYYNCAKSSQESHQSGTELVDKIVPEEANGSIFLDNTLTILLDGFPSKVECTLGAALRDLHRLPEVQSSLPIRADAFVYQPE